MKWPLITLLVAALALGAWRVGTAIDQGGYDRAQAENTTKALKASEEARAKEQALQDKLTKAQNNAKTRETKLVADAATARRAADGLRDDLATADSRMSSATRDTIAEYAATANLVFFDCSRAYQELAVTANGHANDVRMMREGWPQ